MIFQESDSLVSRIMISHTMEVSRIKILRASKVLQIMILLAVKVSRILILLAIFFCPLDNSGFCCLLNE